MSQTNSTSMQRTAGNGSPGAIKLSAMGLTNQKLVVKESRRARRKATVNFLIDSGAVYSLVPSPTLKKLGVRPHRQVDFSLTDGRTIRAPGWRCLFRIAGRRRRFTGDLWRRRQQTGAGRDYP